MEFEHLLAVVIFTVTVTTYLVFLALGRSWRRDFESRGASITGRFRRRSGFLQRLNAGGRMGLMGDATPLALSGAVFQMYMFFSWIGNVPASLLIGTLLPVDITLLMVILTLLNVVPLILAFFLKPYDAGTAITM